MVSKTRFLLFVVASLLISQTVFAGEQRHGSWVGQFYRSNKDIKRAYLWNEIQFRFNHNQSVLQQLLWRTGVGYQWNKHLNVSLLYAFINSQNLDTNSKANEHRFTQQLGWGKSLNEKWSFNTRWRLEQRISEETSQLALRARTLGGMRYRWKEKWSFSFWDEVFHNLNERGLNSDRWVNPNRLFLGVSHHFNGDRVDIGYLNQYIDSSGNHVSEHTLVLYYFY